MVEKEKEQVLSHPLHKEVTILELAKQDAMRMHKHPKKSDTQVQGDFDT